MWSEENQLCQVLIVIGWTQKRRQRQFGHSSGQICGMLSTGCCRVWAGFKPKHCKFCDIILLSSHYDSLHRLNSEVERFMFLHVFSRFCIISIDPVVFHMFVHKGHIGRAGQRQTQRPLLHTYLRWYLPPWLSPIWWPVQVSPAYHSWDWLRPSRGPWEAKLLGWRMDGISVLLSRVCPDSPLNVFTCRKFFNPGGDTVFSLSLWILLVDNLAHPFLTLFVQDSLFYLILCSGLFCPSRPTSSRLLVSLHVSVC